MMTKTTIVHHNSNASMDQTGDKMLWLVMWNDYSHSRPYFIDVHIHIFCNNSYHFIASLFDALTDSEVCKYFTQLLSNGTQSELDVFVFSRRRWHLIFSMIKFEMNLQQMCWFRRRKLYLILYISITDSLHWNLKKTEWNKTESSRKYYNSTKNRSKSAL